MWLEQYDGQTTDELLALAGSYDRTSLVEAFNMGLDQKAHRTKTPRTDTELVVPAVIEFEQEVKNGGYAQFLLNSSGRYAPVIVAALEKLRCPKATTITKAALGALPPNWKDQSIKQLGRALNKFDAQFYQIDEDLTDALFEFISENRSDIQLP